MTGRSYWVTNCYQGLPVTSTNPSFSKILKRVDAMRVIEEQKVVGSTPTGHVTEAVAQRFERLLHIVHSPLAPTNALDK